jgi:hypothetical protein
MASAREAIGPATDRTLRLGISNSGHPTRRIAHDSPHAAHTSIEDTSTIARKSAGSIPRNFNNRLRTAMLLLAVSFSVVSCSGFCQPVFRGLLVLEVVLYGGRSPTG